MGFSPEKTIKKIRAILEEEGYKKDIPFEKFGIATMKILGTNKKPVAGKWIDTFDLFGYITLKDNKINFKEK